MLEGDHYCCCMLQELANLNCLPLALLFAEQQILLLLFGVSGLAKTSLMSNAFTFKYPTTGGVDGLPNTRGFVVLVALVPMGISLLEQAREEWDQEVEALSLFRTAVYRLSTMLIVIQSAMPQPTLYVVS